MLILSYLAIAFMGLVLGLTGGGGSILAVPIFLYMFGMDDKVAIASSLLLVGATSLIAVTSYARQGLVNFKIGGIFGVFAMVGAYGGGYLARFIPGSILVAFFAVLMLTAASAMLRSSPAVKEGEGLKEGEALPLPRIAVQGILVGMVTGLVGAGGGFLVVPALVLLSGLPMKTAVATSLMVITMNSASAFAGYLSHAEVDFRFAAIAVSIAAVGAIVGSNLQRFVDGAKLKKGFGVFVLVIGVFVLFQKLPFDVPPLATLAAMLAVGALGTSIAAKQLRAMNEA